MPKKLLISFVFSLFIHTALAGEQRPVHEDERFAQQIFLNETGGNDEYLLHWNDGEAFASLGIGHFIWFPAGLQSPYAESFPQLLAYLLAQGYTLPNGWTPDTACPWPDKQTFLAARQSPEYKALHTFLKATYQAQYSFILARFQQAQDDIMAAAPAASKTLIAARLRRLWQIPQGRYALIDYVNFKGTGLLVTERYQGQGWGLLQVLLEMQDLSDVTQDFALAAERVLTQRTRNAPEPSKEARWLKGWQARLQTYYQLPD